jgi:hypothetical protein
MNLRFHHNDIAAEFFRRVISLFGERATMPRGTGTPYFLNSSLP